VTVAGTLAVCALCAAFGCNGTLRFDESTDAGTEAPGDLPVADAGVDQAGDLPADEAGCGADAISCGWRLAECTGGGDDDCELHCPITKACSGGTCGTGCVAECQENSSCAITAGDVARVECEQGASCTFGLGNGGNAACNSGSNCRVQCVGRCAITCRTGATCQLRCADDAAGAPVTGTASCP
jgi:hypothetical protein